MRREAGGVPGRQIDIRMDGMVELVGERRSKRTDRGRHAMESRQGDGRATAVFRLDLRHVGQAGEERVSLLHGAVKLSGGRKPPPRASWIEG